MCHFHRLSMGHCVRQSVCRLGGHGVRQSVCRLVGHSVRRLVRRSVDHSFRYGSLCISLLGGKYFNGLLCILMVRQIPTRPVIVL